MTAAAGAAGAAAVPTVTDPVRPARPASAVEFGVALVPVSYTHLTLPTNREV